jgi:hypothetical protein
MFLVSRSVKMSPVAMLRIWDAKMINPEYWTLIWFLLKYYFLLVVAILFFGLVFGFSIMFC